MDVTMQEILGPFGEKQPNLGLTRLTRDALARYCELRWPRGRRNAVEREWGLSADQARSVCEATASASTIDKVWRHPRGGWSVLLPVMGAVIGESAEDFLIDQRRKHIENARRASGLARDIRAGLAVFDHRAFGVDRGADRRRAADRG